MKETILYSTHQSLLRQVQDLEYRSNHFMTCLLHSCCVTRLNNGCEENKFLTRCAVNVEPIFLIHKTSTGHETDRLTLDCSYDTKNLVRNAYTYAARDNVLGIYFSLEGTVTNPAI